MKLSTTAINRIRDSRTLPKKIADVLGVSRTTAWRYIKDNDDELTKAAVTKVIKEETGFSDDEILEECIEKLSA